MKTFEYFVLVINNWFTYLISILIVFFVYYNFFKKYFISILDPFTNMLFFSAVAITVPVFLFMINEIPLNLFLSLFFTQLLFLIGLRVFSPIKIENYNNIQVEKKNDGQEVRFIKWLFIIIGTINIFMQLLSYKMFGIPLFAEKSRLAIYGESGGVNNIIKRVLDVTYQSHIFLTIYFVNYSAKNFMFNFYTKLSVLLILVFSIFSGSKGTFLTFGLAFFVYALYSIRWGNTFLFYKIKKFVFKFGLIVFCIAILVILISEETDNPFLFLLYRIGQSGDVFYMAYPNAVIDKIPSTNWFVGLFASPLSMFGIIPRSSIPEPMGFFLMQYHDPSVEFKGPNARINIFSYVYLSIFYSPFFCFFIGMIVSFFRNKLFSLLPANIFGCILYFLFLNAALRLESDFHSALADFINIIVILPFFLFISYYLSIRKTDG